MVTKEQLLTGILQYIDGEVMPVLSDKGKWVAGAAITLASARYNSIITELSRNPIAQGLGVIQADGRIDADAALTALRDSADKYGSIEFTIPVVGTLTFKATDIDVLKKYILGGNQNDRRIKESVE